MKIIGSIRYGVNSEIFALRSIGDKNLVCSLLFISVPKNNGEIDGITVNLK